MTTARNFSDLSVSPILAVVNEDASVRIDDLSGISIQAEHRALPEQVDGSFRMSHSRNRPLQWTNEDVEEEDDVGDSRCVRNRTETHAIFDSSLDLDVSLDMTSFQLQNFRIGGTPPLQNGVDSFDNSSEEAFRRLERRVEGPLFGNRSSMNVGGDSHSDDSAIAMVLTGVRAFVDLNCCLESESSVKTKLRRMGAIVSRQITDTTTHIIFTSAGSKKACLKRYNFTLELALAMERRPFLLDPHWVHDCFFNRSHIAETQYSLYGGHYLLTSIRRASSATDHQPHHQHGNNVSDGAAELSDSNDCVELSPDIELLGDLPEAGGKVAKRSVQPARPSSSVSISDNTSAELTFDQPMTATQLLTKIDVLSRRLEKVERGKTTDRECINHGNRCASRAGKTAAQSTQHIRQIRSPDMINAQTNTNQDPANFHGTVPLRRRTHAAFALPHRAPHSLATAGWHQRRDEEAAQIGQIRDVTNRIAGIGLDRPSNGAPRNAVDDMRKTAETDLNRIRKTLQQNSQITNRRMPRLIAPKPWNAGPALVESEEESSSQDIITPRGERRRPLVTTASGLINRLQCVPSSDEFATSKTSRLKKPPPPKKGIVFTGMPRSDEKLYREAINSLKLKPQNRVDKSTRCVVSGTGQRTITTLRGVVLGVPVVRPSWIDACEDEERLVPIRGHEYPDWKWIIQDRGAKCKLFARQGRILVLDGCSPPSNELRWMISNSGGKLTTSMGECALIVAPAARGAPHLSYGRRPLPLPIVVSELFIMDCITKNVIQMCNEYLIE